MPPDQWIRDLSFYMIAAITILVFGAVGEVNLWMSIGFIGLYVIYFVTVLYV